MSDHLVKITEQHLAVSLSNPEVCDSLSQLKACARDFSDVRRWLMQHVALLGGVSLIVGDEVDVSFVPDMKELASLKAHQTLKATVSLSIHRNAIRAPDSPSGFNIDNESRILSIKHSVVTYLKLSDWPVAVAQLLVDYRKLRDFNAADEKLTMLEDYFDPLLAMHFQSVTFKGLHDMSAADLLPEDSQAFVDFLFSRRKNHPNVSLPTGMDL